MALCSQKKPKWVLLLFSVIGSCLLDQSFALGNHRSGEGHMPSDLGDSYELDGHAIPGVSFQVFWNVNNTTLEGLKISTLHQEEAIQTVVEAFKQMVQTRTKYRRFDEALSENVLHKVIVEPQVFNRDGKEFLFLVARTNQKGRVKLLVSASGLKARGLINHADQLVPILAREFQWVVSKADTTQRRKAGVANRNLRLAPIVSNAGVHKMSEKKREEALEALLDNYLVTEDSFHSLNDQPYYDIGSAMKISPAQADSTSHFYDIRTREALHLIVGQSDFLELSPKAVRGILSGKIWNISFVHIESRDWATRTRVLPKDKAVKVGESQRTIQPAKILINLHRKAIPDDPYYALPKGLPMGALSTEQLAQVIALEIENQIIEKSMRGHVAEDARSATQ